MANLAYTTMEETIELCVEKTEWIAPCDPSTGSSQVGMLTDFENSRITHYTTAFSQAFYCMYM
jgi:hypothetical protein